MLTKTALFSSALAAGVILALAAPLPASAHVSVDATSAGAGSFTVLTFALSHGCEGSPTTAVHIGIPEDITVVTPTANPNWELSSVGDDAATRTAGVVYTARTPLIDGVRDTFALSLQLPEDAEGSTLAFPVLQTCEIGQTNWDEAAVEGKAEPEHPAPTILVTAAVADPHAHGPATAETGAAETGAAAQDEASQDTFARALGLGGLIVGAVGITLAVTARRRQEA
jgi:uncharacterized protein YcnI